MILVGAALLGGALWWRGMADRAAALPTAPSPVAEIAPPAEGAPAGRQPPRRPMREARGEPTSHLRPSVGAPEPQTQPTHELGIKAYAQAVEAGDENPGEKAFRADAREFFNYNAKLAGEKAAREGITLEELEELTYMGTLAMHLRRWDAVEQVLGHELSAEDQALGNDLIFTASNAMKASIRGQVASGASVEERWKTIREQQVSFIGKYRAITKLSPEEYDMLLALPFMN